jgi:hypothetical protein
VNEDAWGVPPPVEHALLAEIEADPTNIFWG